MSIPKGYRQYRTYRSKQKAREVASKLRKQGFQVTVRESSTYGKGVLYQLFVK